MVQTQPDINQIAAIFPEQIETSQIYHGDDFWVVEINNQWMFRFPRSQDALTIFEIEKNFLIEFAKISPIPVPNYQWIGSGFVGYRKIEGLLLSRTRFQALPLKNRRRIADQIGTFLTSLHSFPIERALQMGMTESCGEWRPKVFQTIKTDIAPRLTKTTLKRSMSCLEAFFSKAYLPAVIHDDFYPRDHLFLDPQKQVICGIIDFGDLTIEDPAYDFKNILSEFGEEALNAVLNSYDGPLCSGIKERINLMIKVEPLFDAAYDLQFGYPGRLTHHIREIEAAFRDS